MAEQNRELAQLERQIADLVEVIADGDDARQLSEEIKDREQRAGQIRARFQGLEQFDRVSALDTRMLTQDLGAVVRE